MRPFILGMPRFPSPPEKYDRANEAQFRQLVERLLQSTVNQTNSNTNSTSQITETLQFIPDNTVDVGDIATPYRPKTGYFATSVVAPLFSGNTLSLSGSGTLGGALSVGGATTIQSSSLTINGVTYTWPASQTANRVLRNTGPGTLAWSQVDLSTDVTGALAGGTVPFSRLTPGTAGAGDYVFPANLTVTTALQSSEGYFGDTKTNFTTAWGAGLPALIAKTGFAVIREAAAPSLSVGRINTTFAAPSIINSGETLGAFQFVGYLTAGVVSPSQVRSLAVGGWSGTASGADLQFLTTTSGTTTRTVRWRISDAGHLVGFADNTYDIGASGATRPASGYFGTSIVIGTDPTGTQALRVGGLAHILSTTANQLRLAYSTSQYWDSNVTSAGALELLPTGTTPNLALFAAGSYGGGKGVVFLGDAPTAPTTAITAGATLYSESGVLRVIDTQAKITHLAPILAMPRTLTKSVTLNDGTSAVVSGYYTLGTGGTLTLSGDAILEVT